MRKLKFIDLFAGLGGFHFALKNLGHKCVLASEIQPDLRDMYTLNHPDIDPDRIIGDIHSDISVSEIPDFDILCAGFPCQPFSKAGYRMGLKDPLNGNHFLKIIEIINHHKPSFIFLENVPNLKGHDNGNTWITIKNALENEGYTVDERILSPDQFGVPQHRKRIYIVGVKGHGGNTKIVFPKLYDVETVNISDYLEEGPKEDVLIKDDTLKRITHWQNFVHYLESKEGSDIPRFPVWSMEFGATYPFIEKATVHHSLKQLRNSKGKFGIHIKASVQEELPNYLPRYSLADKDYVFPKWKIRYIESNREFYRIHKSWVDDWKKEMMDWKLSHQKFEWNCGPDTRYTFEDKIIQFRPSGIRVKNRDRFPALVLSITQVPIIFDKHKKGGAGFRYITQRDAANLQSMPRDNFEIMSNNVAAYKSFGNAVNVRVVEEVVKSVLQNC